MAVKRISTNPRYIGLSTDVKPLDDIEDGSIFIEYTIDDHTECGRVVGEYTFFDNCWHTKATQISDSSGNIVDFVTKNQGEVDFNQSFSKIIDWLKKIELQLSLMTDHEITKSDIEE